MKKFKYYKTLEMEPRFGNKFATIYYKLNAQQKMALTEFVKSVKEDMDQLIERDKNFDDWNEPLKGFKRTGRSENYSAYQIITDLNNQLQAEKDPTAGLVGRWQKMCQDIPNINFTLEEE